MKFTKAINAGEQIDVYNYGNHHRDFTYIDDIVAGVLHTLDHVAEANPKWDPKAPVPSSSKAPWRVYNIGAQTPVHLLTFIELLEQALGKTADKQLLPMQPGDVADTYADVEALVAAVGYRPKVTLEQGIAEFVQWYQHYHCS